MDNLTLTDVLQNKPPGEYKNVQNVLKIVYPELMGNGRTVLEEPPLQLYCENCDGYRLFEFNRNTHRREYIEIEAKGTTLRKYSYFEYLCQNCKKTFKSFFLLFDLMKDNETSANIIKVAEYPFYRAIIPPKLITLLRDDRDLFNKGVQSESNKLGIAAFTYYRRVVENQKNQFIDTLIKILKKLKTDDNTIEIITKAKEEIQFTTAIGKIKDFIPQQLFIDNQNPFTLLYKFLSIGVHNISDEECLDYANSVRYVLTEFINNMTSILKEDKTLIEAVRKLVNYKK